MRMRIQEYPPRRVLDAASSEDISHLVDPASSHMLSSKAKPCMSKYKGSARNCERLITTVAIHMALSLPSRITLGI